MENFTFELPWSIIIIMMLIVMLLYIIPALVYYLLAIVITAQLDKLIKPKDGESRNIFQLALPMVIATTIIYWTLIQLSFQLGHRPMPQDFWWRTIYTSYFKYIGYFAGNDLRLYFFGNLNYITTMTCLLLTRYSFSKNFMVLGRLKNRRTVFNFAIWTCLFFIVSMFQEIFFRDFSFGYFFFRYGLVNILMVAGMTFLFLKWRNTNKLIK